MGVRPAPARRPPASRRARSNHRVQPAAAVHRVLRAGSLLAEDERLKARLVRKDEATAEMTNLPTQRRLMEIAEAVASAPATVIDLGPDMWPPSPRSGGRTRTHHRWRRHCRPANHVDTERACNRADRRISQVNQYGTRLAAGGDEPFVLELIMIRCSALTCLKTALVCTLLFFPACGDDGTSGDTDSGTEGGETSDPSGEPTTGASGGTDSGTMGGAPTTGWGHSQGEAYCVDTVNLNLSTRESSCKCAVETGAFPDLESCLVEFGWWDGQYEIRVCDCDLMGEYPDAAANLQCRLNAAKEYEACLAEKSCGDDDGQDVCWSTFLTVQAQCPAWQAPPEHEAKSLIECHGEPSHTCGSGENIPESWVCNKQAECTDMSDEAECS